MGLKTNNYRIEKLGITLTEAYAVLKKITAERGNGIAVFAVSTNRDNAIDKAAIEERKIQFTYDIEKDNMVIKAYEAAKGQKTVREYNPETGQEEDITINMPFYGWTDDLE